MNTLQALIKTYPKQNGCMLILKPHQYQIIRGDILITESFCYNQSQTINLNLSAQNLPLYEKIYEFEQM